MGLFHCSFYHYSFYHYSLFTVHYSLFTVHYSLFTVHSIIVHCVIMLKINNLNLIFNPYDVNQVQALKNVNLHLPPGEFVTIIGSNGAGKSTLLNVIAGVFPVTAGKIIINGHNVIDWPEYRRAKLVGRVFQDPLLGTAASMTIEQNLTLAAKRNHWRTLSAGVKKPPLK